MGREENSISSDLRLEAVEKYLRGPGSQRRIADEYGISKPTLQLWIAKYEVMGPSGLITTAKNQWYDAELKTAAVEAISIPGPEQAKGDGS